MSIWIERTHPEFDQRCKRNTFVDDHYTGEALQKARKAAESMRQTHPRAQRDEEGRIVPDPPKYNEIGAYLYRRAQGENVFAFDERCRISKFPDDFAAIIDAHVGSVTEPAATRVWEGDDGKSPLGDPSDAATGMGHLWKNADGKGTNWETLIAQASNKAVRSKRLWFYVDGPTDEYQHPKVMLLDQKCVRNWIEKEGVVVEGILHETEDVRTALDVEKDPEKPYEDRYIHYTLEGWGRYKIEGEGDKKQAVLIEKGDWENPFYQDPERTRQCLPLGYIELPLSRDVAYSMSEGANYLFNLSSDIRNILRVANHPKLTGEVDGTQWENTQETIRQGDNLLLGKWTFISPPAENASVGYDIYDQEARKYWTTAFEQMNDAAREATATEIVHKDRGRQAFLVLLAMFLEELENRVLFLLSQIIAPDKPETWRIASVKRSTDFRPLDPDKEFEKRKNAVFGGQLPTTPRIRAAMAKDLLEQLGYELEPEEEKALQAQIEREQKAQEGVQGGIQGKIQEMKKRVAA